MEADMLNALMQGTGPGYGMRNIVYRIETFYGKNFGLEVTGLPGEGTRVVIRIPDSPDKRLLIAR